MKAIKSVPGGVVHAGTRLRKPKPHVPVSGLTALDDALDVEDLILMYQRTPSEESDMPVGNACQWWTLQFCIWV